MISARKNRLIFVLANLLIGLHLSAIAAGSPPDAPDNLQGQITGNQVTITWDVPADDDGVEGYNVYIDNQYADTVSAPAYSGAVAQDQLVSFSVVAFDAQPRTFSSPSQTLVLPESLIPDDLTIPPSIPTNLTGVISDGEITLTWTPSTDDETVQGYNVYRDDRYLTTVAEPRYVGPNAADETRRWDVVAFDIRKNFSSRSEQLTVPEPENFDPTSPPSVPMALQGNVTQGGSEDTVLLTWRESTDNDSVAGYNIYINGDYAATRFSTEYEQRVPAGSINFFQIVSFDFDKNFSSLSQALVLPADSAPTDPGVPPTVPTGLVAETLDSAGQTMVTLTWQASTGPVGVKGYNVYRNNNYFATVSDSTFSDSLPSDQAATYSVVAFDNFDNYSSRSERVATQEAVNNPPFITMLDDQSIFIGDLWELVLSPIDVDGDAAGIVVDNAPDGVQFVDNGDGSRSLIWQPEVQDIGSYLVEITAFDIGDTDLRTSQTIELVVSERPVIDTAPFLITNANQAFNLVEGDANGISIPVIVQRLNGFAGNISLSATTETDADGAGLNISLTNQVLGLASTSSVLDVQLEVGKLPLLKEQRRLIITAQSGAFIQTVSLNIAITPVDRDDVYLLIGQSNMVGISEDDIKQIQPGEPDEPNPRILQASVPVNNFRDINDPERFVNQSFDPRIPPITLAEDPLHEPRNAESGRKSGGKIGPGLSFAKAALPNTTRTIVLVPAALSSSSFCDSDLPAAHWNPDPADNPALGNTLLFDRALARINDTLAETDGILRGILWHQGESDTRDECASVYGDNMVKLVNALRTRIATDARGDGARGTDADIPFVVGTMSKGKNSESDFSVFSPGKMEVDGVHRTIGSLIPYSAVTNNDDLVPANGFPCASSCVHFGAAAYREMGFRMYQSLLQAVANGP